MTLAYRVVTATIGWLTSRLCRIHDAQLARVPTQGPLILVINHINFLEIPVIFTHLQPRHVVGMVKAENWDKPLTRWLANLWGAVPVRRGEADLSAVRQGLEALKTGQILAIAPEGTRSGDGRLQIGHPGVALLALRSQAPLLPVACYGAEHFWRRLASVRRSDFHIIVGNQFYLDAGQARMTGQVRREITDEIMYQLAALLPPAYRGVYSDLDAATEKYLRFLPDGVSNLRTAQT